MSTTPAVSSSEFSRSWHWDGMITAASLAAASVLTRDLCPAAAPIERFMKKPLVLLAAMLSMAVALAAWANPASAFAAFAILAVIVVGYGWPAVVIRGLTAELRFPSHRCVEGEVVAATVRVRNAWPFPVWGIMLEADIGGRVQAALAHLPPRSTTEFLWECVPRYRGDFPFGPAEILTGFPFGIMHARRDVRVDRRVLVWPATVPLESLLDTGETTADDDAVSDRRVGDRGDVVGTRPFRQGDPLRHVHWALTARMGVMVSRERQAPLTTAVKVFADVDPANHGDDGPTGSLENVIRVAASLCVGYHQRGARVECHLGHDRLEVAAGRQGMARFLDELARKNPSDHHERTAPRGRAAAVHGPRQGGLAIAVTTPSGITAASDRRIGSVDLMITIGPRDSAVGTRAPAMRPLPADRVVRLDSGADTLAEFARRWGELRHAT